MGGGRLRGLGAGLVGLALVACGGGSDEEQRPRAEWSASVPAAPSPGGAHAAPQVVELRIEPEEPASGERVRAVVRALADDGRPVQLAYVWSVGGRRLPEAGAELELGDVARGARVEVVVTPSDGAEAGEPARAAVVVRNQRPVLTGIALQPDGLVSLGGEVLALPQARDPDGDSVEFSYEWSVNGTAVEGEGERFSTEGLGRGDRIAVSVVASDADDESDPLLSAEVRVANAPPEILSTPSGVSADGSFRYRVEARDPDGDRNLRYRLQRGPQGMRVDAIYGEVVWTPGRGQVGTHPVEIAVEDSDGARVVQTFELDVRSSDDAAVPAASSR